MFINFDGIINARSLGGIEVRGGRRVRENALLRCAHLADASEADLARLQALGLKYIVDFRDPLEIGRAADKAVAGAEHHPLQALPTFKDREKRDNSATLPDFDSTFATVYTNLAQGQEAQEAYRGFFSLLLEAKGEPVLWHCTQGKDRTGAAAVLLLTALGAKREDIERDYFLSNEGLEHMLRQPIPPHMQRWPEELRKKLFFVYPHLLELYFEKLEQRWGGAEGYLRKALGLGDGDFEKLREYYTE